MDMKFYQIDFVENMGSHAYSYFSYDDTDSKEVFTLKQKARNIIEMEIKETQRFRTFFYSYPIRIIVREYNKDTYKPVKNGEKWNISKSALLI